MKIKFPILSLVSATGLVFMPSLLCAQTFPDGDNSGDEPLEDCLNADGTPSCGSGDCSDEDEGEPTCSPDVGSSVAHGDLRYAMSATDYSFNVATGGCSPCGSSGSGMNNLPSLSLRRNTYSDTHELFSSFGGFSGFDKYDDVINFPIDDTRITYATPGEQETQNQIVVFNSNSGFWERRRAFGKNFAGISLYTEANTLITSPADRDLARTAILMGHDGSSKHFEVIWTNEGRGFGRLVALMDRYGNTETIEYDLPAPTELEIVDNTSVDPFAVKKSISDTYGRKMSFTYTGDYISSVTLPTGDVLAYTYANNGDLGLSIESITHPDGSQSMWSSIENDAHGMREYSFYEPHAAPTKRRKKIFMQDGFAEKGTAIIATQRRLVRFVENGDGESTYANRPPIVKDVITAGGGDGTTIVVGPGENPFENLRYIYEGGNQVRGVSSSGSTNGVALNTFVTNSDAPARFFFENPDNWTHLITSSQENTSRRLLSLKVDSQGKAISIDRNPFTQSVVGRTQADDYETNQTYDNPYDLPSVSTDSLGRKTVNTYDALGNRLTSTRGAESDDETTMTYVYNARGQMIESQDALYDSDIPELHKTIYVYDNAADYDPADYTSEEFTLIQELLTGGNTLYMVGKIEAADTVGDDRAVTSYVNDDLGRVISVTTPASSTDASDEGRTTQFEYDFYNRLTKTTYSDTSTEITKYGEGGSGRENLVVEKVNRNGISTTYEYDESDRLVTTTIAPGSAEESVETCTYLSGTKLKQTRTRNGETTTYLFDYRNRVIGMTVQADANTNLTTHTEYDILNRRRSTTDAYGRKTFYLYDQNDRVIKTVKETFPDALSNAPRFSNIAEQTSTQQTVTLTDLAGNTLETENTHIVNYTDPRDIFLNDLVRDSSPNAPYLITESVYDSEGQMVISTDARGFDTWMEYDELGRNTLLITAVGEPSEIRSETIYDDNSNVIETRSPRYFTEGTGGPSNTNSAIVGLGLDLYDYNGRNLRASHTTAAGSAIEATQSWTFFLDGRADKTTDFRGNFIQNFWHICCGRFQASLQQDGTSGTISNTDYYGNVTHTASVKNFSASAANYHNPIDADTLAETTTRFDGRGRPTFTTQWLKPLGEVNDEARLNLGNGVIPIAGLDGISSTDGLTMSYEYDEDLTDGQGIDAVYSEQLAELTTRYGYNPFSAGSNGYAVAVTNAENETSVRIQDGAGRTILSINGEGDITTMDYDFIADVSSDFSSPSADITIGGNLLTTSSTDANGNTNIAYTDGAGRTLITEDGVGNFAAMAYDNNSNAVITRDANGLGQNCEYDALNRDISCADLQEQAEGNSRTKFYNAASQVVSSINADNEEISNIYDARNRMTSSTDGNNITTGYAYDDNNNLITLTDGKGEDRQWFYDARNLATTKTYPSTTGNDFYRTTYDALQRPTLKIDQLGDSTISIYDLAGRLTLKRYRSGGALESVDSFVYDAASRVIRTTKGRYNITTNHTYADDSMPLTEVLRTSKGTFVTRRTYDAGNRPISQVYPSGESTKWAYDERNLVTSVRYQNKLITTKEYDAGNRLTFERLGNKLRHLLVYGRQDNLRSLDRVVGKNDLHLAYNYAADKQIIAENILGDVLQDTSFSANYDDGNRITSWSRPDNNPLTTNQTWDYDDAGNWNNTSKTIGNQTTTENRSYNAADGITNIAGEDTEQDLKGNLTDFEINGKEYKVEYDLDNRMSKVEVGNEEVEYSYDAMGRRVLREEGSDETALIWWGNTEIAKHHHTAIETVIQNDIFDHPSRLNAVCARAVEGSQNKLEWFHKNYLDHVYAVSDDSGDILEHYRYTAFGEAMIYDATGAIQQTSQIDNDILWNTRRQDEVSGFYLYKYRHYSAELGRWLGRDPIEEDGGINLYAFVGNNPIGRWDKLGLQGGIGRHDLSNHPSLLPSAPGQGYVPAPPGGHVYPPGGWRITDKQFKSRQEVSKLALSNGIKHELRLNSETDDLCCHEVTFSRTLTSVYLADYYEYTMDNQPTIDSKTSYRDRLYEQAEEWDSIAASWGEAGEYATIGFLIPGSVAGGLGSVYHARTARANARFYRNQAEEFEIPELETDTEESEDFNTHFDQFIIKKDLSSRIVDMGKCWQ